MNYSLNHINSLPIEASAQQQGFEQLLQAISLEKQGLADWQALADLHQREVLANYLPLRRIQSFKLWLSNYELSPD